MTTRVIIPVMDEAENVCVLAGELAALNMDLSVDFIDDSRTLQTVGAIKRAQDIFPGLSVAYLHRTGDDRTGGIIGAVRDGIVRAQREGNPTVVVMDGDGQHDPRFIPAMVERLRLFDVVVGSRYHKEGSREGLDGPLRVAVSVGATWVARGMFPEQLKGLTDPMSGFFGLCTGVIDTDAFDANGFKVLLEIMLTHAGLSRTEVPVVFRNRHGGDSKARPAVAAEYLSQLIRRKWALARSASPAERKFRFENV